MEKEKAIQSKLYMLLLKNTGTVKLPDDQRKMSDFMPGMAINLDFPET